VSTGEKNSVFPYYDNEAPSLSRFVRHIGQNERTTEPKVHVDGIFGLDVKHGEIIRYKKTRT
jgi:hypothetical protein